jgi:hypothetical protein
MRFNERSRSGGASVGCGFIAAITIAFAVAGCASVPAAVEMEPKSIARELGFPSCRVSVPLSQAEVIADAKRMGNPKPESYPEWIEMTASIRSGDQLRLVDCLRANRSTSIGDPYYYALIRGGKIVSKFHFILIN